MREIYVFSEILSEYYFMKKENKNSKKSFEIIDEWHNK